jgi:hypothetical protein
MESPENKLYCKCCQYQAKFPSEFNKHLLSKKHARQGKKKDYSCTECEYVATTHWNLKIHHATKHMTLEQKKALKYYCIICNSVTFSQMYYNQHVNSTMHKNNVILSENKNGIIKNNDKQNNDKQNNDRQNNDKQNIDLPYNEPNLRIYIKQLLDEMKHEIIDEIKKING